MRADGEVGGYTRWEIRAVAGGCRSQKNEGGRGFNRVTRANSIGSIWLPSPLFNCAIVPVVFETRRWLRVQRRESVLLDSLQPMCKALLRKCSDSSNDLQLPFSVPDRNSGSAVVAANFRGKINFGFPATLQSLRRSTVGDRLTADVCLLELER